jgi:hypothetical protein
MVVDAREMSDPDKATERQTHFMSLTEKFAHDCAELKAGNPYEWPPLTIIMNWLATELWDNHFSVSEIRSAFEAPAADIPRYAAGEERRGDR